MFAEASDGKEELQDLMERNDKMHPLSKLVRQSPSLFMLAALASFHSLLSGTGICVGAQSSLCSAHARWDRHRSGWGRGEIAR